MLSFLGFVVVIVLLFWIGSVSNRLSNLEKKVQNSQMLPSTEPVPAPAQDVWPPHQPPVFNTSVAPSQPQTVLPAAEKTSGENIFAGNWLTKIGVLAVVIGIGFFIKYAIDMGWINEWTRVILGLACGVLLCLLGGIWKDKYPKYAAALTGGGIAIMYFSVFSAYQFYSLIPQAVALVFMVAISVFGVYLAYSRKVLELAALAVLGAYLSPIMLHTAADQHAALFIYLTLLNLFVVAVMFGFYWSELLFMAFLGSVVDFAIWGGYFLTLGNTTFASAFAAMTFLLLIIGGTFALRKHKQANTLPADGAKYFSWLVVLLGIFYSLSMYMLLYRHFHDYLSIMGLLGSVGAFLAYVLVDRLELKEANFTLALVGAGLLSLACIWQFTGKTTDFMLIALGLLLVVSGVLLKRAELRVWGLLTLVACVFAVIITPYDTENYVFILNSKFGLVLAETAALWLTGWLYNMVEPSDTEARASEAAHSIGSLVLWFGFSWELAEYFRNNADMVNTRNLLLSLWWIGYATALMVFGAAAKMAFYKKISLVLFVLAIAKVFLYDVITLETGYRVVSFIVLGVILLTVSYSYQKNKEKITEFLGGKGQSS